MNNKIRVLVVDDSAVVRQVMKEILEADNTIEVMGMAADPFIAAEKIRKEIPDVITLDVEMPRMDGLTFLQKIMTQHPIPVVICSSLTVEGDETTLRALELGAVDIVAKSLMGVRQYIEESKIRICDAVKAAVLARPGAAVNSRDIACAKKFNADVIIPRIPRSFMIRTTEKIVAVGASTGGTEALRVFLEAMPADCPGIAVVQHMPEKFTRAFADRLNGVCDIEVKEAENNDTITRGRALIAPGNRHMLVKRSGARYYVEIKDGPLVSRHRPSVDVLFRSAAQFAGANVIGVIMTGMGDDGAKGMLEMKEAGAYNIAQDEKSCVIFGMPNEAVKLGAVDQILPLDLIAGAVIREYENQFRGGCTVGKSNHC